jgi:cytochrome c biogenesis protein CcdA
LEIMLVLATGTLLGSLHAFDADHLVAVSAFAVRRPTQRAALGFGLRWAAGHGGTIVVVGTALLALGAQLPDASGVWLEQAVGLSLVGLGVWTVRGARKLHPHGHDASAGGRPKASHGVPDSPHPGHAATAVGALHGLAGTGPMVALLPVTTLDSTWAAAAYLVTFALGTAMAMALYATFAGRVFQRAAAASHRASGALVYTAGLGSIGVGILWLVSA